MDTLWSCLGHSGSGLWRWRQSLACTLGAWMSNSTSRLSTPGSRTILFIFLFSHVCRSAYTIVGTQHIFLGTFLSETDTHMHDLGAESHVVWFLWADTVQLSDVRLYRCSSQSPLEIHVLCFWELVSLKGGSSFAESVPYSKCDALRCLIPQGTLD